MSIKKERKKKNWFQNGELHIIVNVCIYTERASRVCVKTRHARESCFSDSLHVMYSRRAVMYWC